MYDFVRLCYCEEWQIEVILVKEEGLSQSPNHRALWAEIS